MGGTGSNGNGLMGMAPTGGGGSFLSGIPWWAYLIVILIGLGISIFCFVQYKAARRRAMVAPLPCSPPPLPGAPPPPPAPLPGAGNGFLISGIASGLLLVLAPLIVMLIMQPWGDNWIVGRWSERPGCMGDTVEFTSGGMLISEGLTKAYRLDGDRITVDGRTETVQHDGDRLTVRSETMYRCGGSGAAGTSGSSASLTPPPSSSGSGYDSPQRAHVPSSMNMSSTPVPSYASWVVGRWSDSDCTRAMEFRSDGTATTANGQPATFTVTPNGPGVGIIIDGGPQRIAGYLDQDGDSGAILRAYAPNSQTLNLRRCY